MWGFFPSRIVRLIDVDLNSMSTYSIFEPELQSWWQTLDSIAEQARLMDAIHEAHPGKENRALRDELCKPHRAVCVRLHYRRIALVSNRSKRDSK